MITGTVTIPEVVHPGSLPLSWIMILDHPGAHLDLQLLMTMTLVQATAPVQDLMEVHPVLLEHPGVTMILDQAPVAPAPVQALTMVDLLTIR